MKCLMCEYIHECSGGPYTIKDAVCRIESMTFGGVVPMCAQHRDDELHDFSSVEPPLVVTPISQEVQA